MYITCSCCLSRTSYGGDVCFLVLVCLLMIFAGVHIWLAVIHPFWSGLCLIIKPYRKRIVWLLFQFSHGWNIAVGEKFFVHAGCLGTLGLSSLQVGNDCLGRWGFCGPDEGCSRQRGLTCAFLEAQRTTRLVSLRSSGGSSLAWCLTQLSRLTPALVDHGPTV